MFKWFRNLVRDRAEEERMRQRNRYKGAEAFAAFFLESSQKPTYGGFRDALLEFKRKEEKCSNG